MMGCNMTSINEYTDEQFVRSILENPKDDYNLMLYHDWLLDRGRGLDAKNLMDNMAESPITRLKDLRGKILLKIDTVEDDNFVNDEIVFTTLRGQRCKLYHRQDCCESVGIEDINGDLADLLYTPLTVVEENSNQSDPEDGDSQTWTFYKFATAKGYVDIRWYGTSNGYYSESVDFAVWAYREARYSGDGSKWTWVRDFELRATSGE